MSHFKPAQEDSKKDKSLLESRKVIYIDQKSRNTVKLDSWKQKKDRFGGRSDATCKKD
jgi:hypothetical protein